MVTRVMTTARRLLLLSLLLTACKEKPQGTGVVVAPDAATTTTAAVEAGAPAQMDITKCPGCQLVPQPAWTFEGVYSDPQCTEPVAQILVPACAAVPALGQTSLTYADEVGLRKAGEQANVTLAAEVAPQSPRFRKAGKTCVKANETATEVAPTGCAGQRVCSDEHGALTCTACRMLANGCADYEETRLYAAITDPGIKGAHAAPGQGGNVARLQQCCAALAAQAKALGPSPEAGLITQAAAQCSAMVAAAGPNGNAPELGVLRSLLAGRNIPAICAGF